MLPYKSAVHATLGGDWPSGSTIFFKEEKVNPFQNQFFYFFFIGPQTFAYFSYFSAQSAYDGVFEVQDNIMRNRLLVHKMRKCFTSRILHLT